MRQYLDIFSDVLRLVTFSNGVERVRPTPASRRCENGALPWPEGKAR